MKKWVLGLLCCMIIFIPFTTYAAGNSKIAVSINKMKIMVNGKAATGNNILYNNTTYLPIRNVADMLGGLTLSYSADGKTVQISRSEDQGSQGLTKNDIMDQPSFTKIDVTMNTLSIMLEKKKVESDNFIYKGRTYAPLRVISEMLGVDIYFHKPNSTVYIGTIPDGALTQTPSDTTTSSNLYHVAASGKMAGWMQLKGHPYESEVALYYKINDSIVTMSVQDVRDLDMNEIIHWTDTDGNARTNTRGELFRIFADFSNQYTQDILYEMFGESYTDYLEIVTAHYENIISQYLEDTGQEPASDTIITLKPDTEFVSEEATPKAGYGKWGDGTVVFSAYDKYGKYRGQFIDRLDNNYQEIIAAGENLKLSDRWMALSFLEQIYKNKSSYVDKTLVLQQEKDTIFSLTFQEDWHQLNVKETTVDGIRVRKFNHNSSLMVSETWVSAGKLESMTDGTFVYGDTPEGDRTYKLYSPYDSEFHPTILLEIVVPASWIGSKGIHETTSGGVRLKQENSVLSFNVEDLKKVGTLPATNEHDDFDMYLNVDDLIKKGILK